MIKRVGRGLGLDIRRSARSLGSMDAFLAHLRRVGFVPTSVLDVGANQADWSRLAHQYFPQAKFVLVEPQVEMRPYLEAFCHEVAGARWKLAGAGREAGELKLTVYPDLACSSLVHKSETNSAIEQRRIPIITIDSLFDEGQELPQLAKLDIQGFELEALAGATRLFGHTECFIVEVSLYKTAPALPIFAEVVSFFDDRGYKVYDIPGHLRGRPDNELCEVDLAFIRKGGVLDRNQD